MVSVVGISACFANGISLEKMSSNPCGSNLGLFGDCGIMRCVTLGGRCMLPGRVAYGRLTFLELSMMHLQQGLRQSGVDNWGQMTNESSQVHTLWCQYCV